MLRRTRQLLRLAPRFFVQVLIGVPIYFLSGFMPRNKTLCVFGAWEGQRFRGNAKYLFLYLQAHPSGWTPVWVTRSDAIRRQLEEDGLPVATALSWRGWWACARAQYVFMTHGVMDINPYVLRGALVIHLSHATKPLKKMGYDHRQRMAISERIYSFLRGPFEFFKDDYACATSSATAAVTATALGIPLPRVWVTGTPHSDYLRGELPLYPRDVVSRDRCIAGRSHRFLIYYAPTFRNNHTFNPFAFAFDGHALEAFLERTDSVLVVSFHPFDAQKCGALFPASSRIILDRSTDVFLMLSQASVLITDYSSLAYDYILLDRPMIFANFDHAGYVRERPLYSSYEEMTPGTKASDWPAVLRELENILVHGIDAFAASRNQMKSEIYAHHVGLSCERILARLKAVQDTV